MKKHIGRLAAAAAALTLVTTCLLGGTLAKYTSTVEGSGTATVAKWKFEVNKGTATFDVDLADTTNRKAYGESTLAGGVIAPGTEGSFAIEIDATGSEVGIDYSIAFSDLKNKPTNMKFYSDAAYNTELDLTNANSKIEDTIAANATEANKKVTKTVYWKWDFGDAADDTTDASTASAAKTMTFKITVTGEQQTPTTTS